jgi:Tfp pilus assembly protein PilX
MSTVENQQGVALIIALIVMTTLSVLVIASLEMLTTNVQISTNHTHELQALYVAEAGVEDAISELRADSGWNAGFTDKEFPTGTGNSYTVSVTGTSPKVIRSTGTVGDFQKTLQVQVAVNSTSVRIESWEEGT